MGSSNNINIVITFGNVKSAKLVKVILIDEKHYNFEKNYSVFLYTLFT